MKPPYSGRLIQWTSLYNGHFFQEGMKWHNSYNKPLWQTLVTNTLCTGHFIADIILRSQLTLLSRTDHSIEEKPNNRPYKVFLVRRLYKFNFGQCFTISFKFSSIFVILSWDEFNGPFRSIKMRNCKDFQSAFTSMIDVFCQLQKCPMRNGIRMEIWIQSWKFLLHMDNHLFFEVWVRTHHRNRVLVQFFGWLFYTLQTLTNQWLSNDHINMISSNILHLGCFFSLRRPFDTLWIRSY